MLLLEAVSGGSSLSVLKKALVSVLQQLSLLPSWQDCCALSMPDGVNTFLEFLLFTHSSPKSMGKVKLSPQNTVTYRVGRFHLKFLFLNFRRTVSLQGPSQTGREFLVSAFHFLGLQTKQIFLYIYIPFSNSGRFWRSHQLNTAFKSPLLLKVSHLIP